MDFLNPSHQVGDVCKWLPTKATRPPQLGFEAEALASAKKQEEEGNARARWEGEADPHAAVEVCASAGSCQVGQPSAFPACLPRSGVGSQKQKVRDSYFGPRSLPLQTGIAKASGTRS